ASIDSEDDTPIRDAVYCAVVHQRCRLLAAATGPDVIRPCESEAADIGGIDLLQRTVTSFTGSQSIGQPLFPGPTGVADFCFAAPGLTQSNPGCQNKSHHRQHEPFPFACTHIAHLKTPSSKQRPSRIPERSGRCQVRSTFSTK